MSSTQDAILALARTEGLLRPVDLESHELPRVSLTRLVRQDRLARVGRGLYALPDREVSEHSVLSEVSRRHPRVAVCLLSALRFHELTTQAPREVWIAIPNKARAPRLDYRPIRVARFTENSMRAGIDEQRIDGVPVRVTNVAKTIADCFKYRNKVGFDVALEALKEVLGQGAQDRRLASTSCGSTRDWIGSRTSCGGTWRRWREGVAPHRRDRHQRLPGRLSRCRGLQRGEIALCLRGEIMPLMGTALLAEYEDVLGRDALFERSRLDSAERDELLDIFLARYRWTRIYYGWRPNVPDEGDNHLVELAVASGARAIVTRNLRDLERMDLRFPALKLMKPEDLLREVRK